MALGDVRGLWPAMRVELQSPELSDRNIFVDKSSFGGEWMVCRTGVLEAYDGYIRSWKPVEDGGHQNNLAARYQVRPRAIEAKSVVHPIMQPFIHHAKDLRRCGTQLIELG